MDSGEELKNDSTTDDGSSNFLWLAASLIGGTLFFMLLAIVFIVIWKCYRKQNTNNWAGPSPLTDGTVPAGMMFKEEVTTSPAKSASMYYGSPVTFENSEFLNEDYDTTNEQPEKNVEGKQSHIEKNNKGKAGITIPLPMTCENNVLSRNELSNQHAEKLASEDSNLPLPPPPDYVFDCPMAPPEINFYASPSDVHCKDDIIQCEINLENNTAQMEDLYTSRPNQDNDLPPPPPPPEFL